MIKKLLPTKQTFTLFALIIALGIALPQTTHAWIADALATVPGFLSLALLQILSLILYLSGTVLNFVMNYTVVNMADNISQAGIADVWRTLRDVANMGFIFILLYGAIQLILGMGQNTRKLIVNVIIVALLINFSLFFTKLVIDASNVLAVTFYGAMAPSALSGEDIINTGLANSIMEPLKVQTLSKEVINLKLDGTKALTVGVLGSIFVLIAAFVFFAISIMLIIRFVVLIFILILSPLAFVSTILPQTSKHFNAWKDALIGQAFFAPIYLLLTWIVISVSGNLYSGDQTASLAGAIIGSAPEEGGTTAPKASDIGLVVNFMVIIGLLIASLMISKSWANKAGSTVSSMTKWALGAAGGASFGMAGRLGRNTLGKAGQAVADSGYLKDRPESRMARLALAAGRKTGSASFDARGVKATGGLGAGKAIGKGGYTKREEEKEKRRVEEAKRYEENVSHKEVEKLVDTSSAEKIKNEKIRAASLAMDPSSPESVKEAHAKIEEAKIEFAKEEAKLRESAEKEAADNAKAKTKERKDRFAESLSKTRWYHPNLYASVKNDRQAALKIRRDSKEKSDEEKLADLASKIAKKKEKAEKEAEGDNEAEVSENESDESKESKE